MWSYVMVFVWGMIATMFGILVLVHFTPDVEEEMRKKIVPLVLDGLTSDGINHKQWYFEELLKIVEPTSEDIWNCSWEPGVTP